MTTITGRTYNATRPRGLAPWKPHAKTLLLLDHVVAVLTEYANHLPITLRQVFYRLVAGGSIEKTEPGYDKLCEMLNRARRAGFIDWGSIRDDGVTKEAPYGFDGKAAFWRSVRATASRYRRDLTAEQPRFVELWVEAAGMVPQVSRIAHPYGVTVYSSSGFDSLTAKHSAARRFVNADRPTLVLHVGDYDPSGLAVIDSLADDVYAFVDDYGKPGIVTFERIAVTPFQIELFDLATAPQKTTDRRGADMPETVQCEALAPDELAQIVTDAIEDHIDLDALAAVRAKGQEERSEILALIAELGL